MVRVFEIDVAPVGFESMFDETGGDRAGLDQDHMDARASELHAECVGERLDGEFRGANKSHERARR